MEEVHFIKNVTKEYPKMFKIIVYKEPLAVTPTPCVGKRKKKDSYIPDERSLRRSRQMIKDICLCNEFDYFCTFTFDQKIHDRYNIQHCRHVMECWLRNQRYKHSPDLRYLVVPELHKDGALHFHALISHFNGPLRPAKHKVHGRTVYNLSGYRAGFSTAVRIDNHEAVANYVTKYITKDLTVMFGSKRYFSSNNLVRPKKITNSDVIRYALPLFKRKIYETPRYDVYNVIKL